MGSGSQASNSNFSKLRADKRRPPLQAPRPSLGVRGWGGAVGSAYPKYIMTLRSQKEPMINELLQHK